MTAAAPTSKSAIAPAGSGKTHRIAESVAGLLGKRSLVLTHTNAGVGVIKQRLTDRKVSTKRYHVCTIDGWCLRLVQSFPASAKMKLDPNAEPPWDAVRTAAANVLGGPFAYALLTASYGRVYVDEYQDCNLGQHAVIEAISKHVGVRVIGDPLQGIYAFAENKDRIVSWSRHVCSAFPLDTSIRWEPRRWGSNKGLGEFVTRLRREIVAGGPIDLAHPAVRLQPLDFKTLYRALAALPKSNARVLIIREQPNQCLALARRLGRPYRVVESISCGRLTEFLEEAESSQGNQLPMVVIELADACRQGLSEIRDQVRMRLFPKPRSRPKPPDPPMVALLESCVRLASTRALSDVGLLLENFAKAYLFRPDPIRLLKQAIAKRPSALVPEWRSILAEVKDQQRHVPHAEVRYGIGTTKVLKGLQTDHAVVMDVDKFDAADLYVALTRGSKALSVFSNEKNLPPRPCPAMVQDAIQAGLL